MATEVKPPSDSNPPSPNSAVDSIAKDQMVEAESTTEVKRGRIPKPEMVDQHSRIVWEYVIPVVAFHLAIPLVFIFPGYLFSWWGIAFLFIGNYFFTSLGIGAGYHRLLTHKGFECAKWFEYWLALMGVCSFQDSPARWVLVHRVHHQHSDHQPDPHTPKVSGWWSHIGWLFVENRQLSTASAYDRYVRDLMRDPLYMWLQKGINWVLFYAAHAILIGVIGYVVGVFGPESWGGGLRVAAMWFFWGVMMRTIFTWHVTWGINSAAHMWGYRNYETREDSRNNWLFALLTNGEGWHNNHHADPRSAQHGHKWWEVDVTYISLVFFEKIGVIKKLVRPNQSALERKVAEESS